MLFCPGMTNSSPMPQIVLVTNIKAPQERVFDLSRSIDLHKVSMLKTQETAVAGRTSGLIGMGESVTWRAKHFGFFQTLSVIITSFEMPDRFVDEMTKGIFAGFRHEHSFAFSDGQTVMTDNFDYQAPLGLLGKLANFLFLKSYMTRLLDERNAIVKEFAETDRWKEVLPIGN